MSAFSHACPSTINYKHLLLIKLMRLLILPRLLQPKVPRHLLINQRRRPMEINIMITIREPLHMELLRADLPHSQRINQHRRVLEMHIIISSTVLNEESSSHVLEPGGLADRGSVVATFVGGEQFHVPFCVHAVIETPVGDGRGENGEGEGVGVELEDFAG